MPTLLRQRVTYSGPGVVGPAVSTIHWLPTNVDTANAAAAQTRTFNFLEAIKSTFAGGCLWAVSGATDFVDMLTGDLVGSITIADVSSGGSASGEPLPPANQGHIRFETGAILRGRRVRGHWYLPGVAEVSSNGGWTGAIYANVAAAKTAFIGTGLLPVVYNRPVGPHGSIRTGSYSGITDVVARSKFAVLRSRRD